jgi:hypothetical protein
MAATLAGAALEPFDLLWLEIDSYDPTAVPTIRRSAHKHCFLPVPVY